MPFVVLDDTPVTFGPTASTRIAFAFPNEFAPPGDARVSVAAFPPASFIVPEFRPNADVER